MSEGYVVNMTTHANMLGVPTHDYEASSVQWNLDQGLQKCY
jgi:hypothetical protein